MPTPMPLQEIFDTSVNHLRKQGRRSSLTPDSIRLCGDGCKYRLPQDDGTTLMCAAGPFIVHYKPAMESQSWSDVSHIFPDAVVPMDVVGIKLTNRLQRVHDNYLPADWEEEWQDVAITYDLVYTPPTQESTDAPSNL